LTLKEVDKFKAVNYFAAQHLNHQLVNVVWLPTFLRQVTNNFKKNEKADQRNVQTSHRVWFSGFPR